MRKQLDGAYKELHTGFQTKSPAKIKKFFDQYGHSQFVYIGVKGQRQTKQELVQMFGGMPANLTMVKSTAVIDRLKLKGDTATVGTVGGWKMIFTGPDSKKQTLEGKTIMTDTWVKTPGGWKLKQSKVESEKMTSNGKPYPG